MSNHARRFAGAALILVIIVIAALVAISAPFAVSMRLHEKSARGYTNRIKARRLAEVGARDAESKVMLNHEDERRRNRGNPNGDDEDWDNPSSLRPRASDILGGRDTNGELTPLPAHGVKSTMFDVDVKDERGKIDVNTCNAEVLANLLGVTVTTDELSYEETNFLPVADVRPFYTDGDSTTLDGVVRVGGEYIGYRDVSVNPPGLKGLIRGMFFTRQPPPDDAGGIKMKTPAGSLVQDFRGWKIAWDSVWRYSGSEREGELARFETPSAVRKIADWEFGTLAFALYAATNGVTFDKLREWGITKDKLDLVGVSNDTADGKDLHEKQNAEAAKRLQDAEKGLREHGIDPSLIKGFGGNKAVIGAFETIKGLDSDQVANYVKMLKERAQKIQERQEKHDSFWRAEVKRQLDELIALKEKSREVEVLSRVELERIRPWITVDSSPDGEAWSDPQVVNHAVNYEPYDAFAKLRIQDARRFRSGALVRVRRILPPGVVSTGGFVPATEYRRCVGVGQAGPDYWEVHLFPQLENDYDESTIEISCQQPRPLNLNAASREVLVAALTGLQTPLFQKQSAGMAPNFVTPDEAAKVAQRILDASEAGSLHSHKDLKSLLDDAKTAGEIDDGDEESILLNAVDPGNRLLAHGTVPFCYKSGNVYEVTATGIENDAASNEIARLKMREIAEVAPPRDLIWYVDSQDALNDKLASNGIPGQGVIPPPGGVGMKNANAVQLPSMGYAFVRGRWASLMDTFPVDCFTLPWQFPDRTHSGQGLAQLSTGRDYDQPPMPAQLAPGGNVVNIQIVPGTVAYANHFDLEREGHHFSDGDIDLGQTQLAVRGFPVEDGSVRLHLGPGTLRGWFKIHQLTGSAKTYIYDGGKGDHNSRICLYYDEHGSPANGPALVAQVYDESLDATECGEVGKPPRPTVETIAAIKPLTPDNWYHIALAWKGGERGDLAIVLDGKLVSKEASGTRLSGPIDGFTTQIPVDSTVGFPDQGWIRIGGYRRWDGTLAGDWFTHTPPTGNWNEFQDYGEVVYYNAKTANSFTIAAPDPQRWAAMYIRRHGPTVNIPAPPPALEANVRLPWRGSGRFQAFADPGGGGNTFDVRTGVAHEIGTPVTLFGYTEWVKNGPNWTTRWPQTGPLAPKIAQYQETVRKGGATLTQPLPENTPFTLVYKFPATRDANQNFVCMTALDTDVPVVWCGAYPDNPTPAKSMKLGKPGSVGGFPPQGIIRVGNERIFYRHLDPVGHAFRNCTRGLDGTGAQVHYIWEGVALESVGVSDTTDYPDRWGFDDPSTYVQLTPQLTPAQLKVLQDPIQEAPAEWISVMKIDPSLGFNGFLMPAYFVDTIGPNSGGIAPVADPAGHVRFVKTPQKVGQPPNWINYNNDYNGSYGFPVKGDNRWFNALFSRWQTNGFNLGMNPGAQVLQVPTVLPAPWGAQKAPVPPLVTIPPDAWPLKEFLKQMEPNMSRAAKGTVKFSSLYTQTAPVAPSLGYTGTSAGGGRQHPPQGSQAQEKVVPTFIVGSPSPLGQATSGMNSLFTYAGKGDVVTLTDDTGGVPDREEHTICWVGMEGVQAAIGSGAVSPASGPQPDYLRPFVCDAGAAGLVINGGSLNGDWGTGQIMAFEDFVQRPYNGTDHARIVRYPSGQLPGQTVTPLDIAVGRARMPSGPGDTVSDAPGNFDGYVDELISTQEGEPAIAEDNLRAPPPYGNATLKNWPQPPAIDASTNNYETCRPPDANFTQALRSGILFKLDDELLACKELGTSSVGGQGLQVLRGADGTTPDNHGPEALLWWNFPFPKIAICQDTFDPLKASSFTIRMRPRPTVVPGLPPGDVINDKNFYIGIDRGQAQGGIVELLPIKYRRGSQLFRPRDRFDKGCFRGAFGTEPASPDLQPGDVLYDHPFRFHDRYQPSTSSIEGVFFEASKEIPGAYFESITWDEANPNPYTKCIIAVRVDGGPPWDADPAMKLQPGQKGRLYIFDDPKALNKILIKGDRVEVRAYMTFKPRAFIEDGWKQTPVLKAIKLTYRQPTRIRRREEMQE